MKNDNVDFGFEKVSPTEKTNRVRDIFTSVAKNYDIMNDLMSFGLHRIWKKILISESGVRTGSCVLDVAAGTADLSKVFAKKVGNTGCVIASDINYDMLSHGRDRLADQGIVENIAYVQADAEALPFPNDYFDCITIGFGLRNVTNKQAALNSMYRILKPGGKCLILEFSHVSQEWLSKIYDFYSFKLLPKIGKAVAKDEASYRYLAESIRMHPDQDTLKNMLEEAGFEDCKYQNLMSGIVAIHQGNKYE